jgi:hypothetical protein
VHARDAAQGSSVCPGLAAVSDAAALRAYAAGAVCGAALPVLGVVVIAAFNGFYWLPIRGESPGS